MHNSYSNTNFPGHQGPIFGPEKCFKEFIITCWRGIANELLVQSHTSNLGQKCTFKQFSPLSKRSLVHFWSGFEVKLLTKVHLRFQRLFRTKKSGPQVLSQARVGCEIPKFYYWGYLRRSVVNKFSQMHMDRLFVEYIFPILDFVAHMVLLISV